MPDNYYDILGVSSSSTTHEIKKAYRKLAKRYHPDLHPNNPLFENEFKTINKAYEILSDEQKRANYDYSLEAPGFYAPESEGRPSQSRPGYAPRAYYRQKKREYTPTAWMYGKLFIIGFIMVVILGPIGLLYQSTVVQYENGLEAENKGSYYLALAHYSKSLSMWGGRNLESSIRGASLCIYKLNEYNEAQYFIKKGFSYSNNDSIRSLFHYYAGLSYIGLKEFDMALNEFKVAEKLHYSPDSLHYREADLLAYELNLYQEALVHYQYLLDHNLFLATSWFGKGWCEQNLQLVQEAIESYNEAIYHRQGYAMAYYYRGYLHVNQQDSSSACSDFKNAALLGIKQSESIYHYYCTDSTQIN
ncbi:MAG: DnaJ domain-containing protein [Cyclobacteriaceae bacterium]|nr:DnaJ domain-containing protein [Cyclobacteriaceae bacterium]